MVNVHSLEMGTDCAFPKTVTSGSCSGRTFIRIFKSLSTSKRWLCDLGFPLTYSSRFPATSCISVTTFSLP